jgi:hypothetical protein
MTVEALAQGILLDGQHTTLNVLSELVVRRDRSSFHAGKTSVSPVDVLLQVNGRVDVFGLGSPLQRKCDHADVPLSGTGVRILHGAKCKEYACQKRGKGKLQLHDKRI